MASISEQRTRAAGGAARGSLALLVAGALCGLALLFAAPAAHADKVISEPGSDPGQTLQPGGLATHFETGRLYVADTNNNRIQVFDKDGVFVKAFGSKGSGPGQFEGPRSIAVDNSAGPDNGDVYVVDGGNGRIQKFGPEGEFKLAIGSKGTGEGQFNFEAGPVLVGVGPGGVVYVVDSLKAGSEFEYRLQKFDSSGALIPPQIVLSKEQFPVHGLALNSTGDFYVFSAFDVQRYDENGSFVEEISDPFEDAGIYALAVAKNDHPFLASSGLAGPHDDVLSVIELNSAGKRVRRFGYGSLLLNSVFTAVAADPSGAGVYVGEGNAGDQVLRVDFPPPGPLVFPKPCSADPLGNSKATLKAEINPEGKATTYHFQYISEKDFEANVEDKKDGFDGATSTPESAPLDANFKLARDHDPDGKEGPLPPVIGPNAQATGLIPETKYRCRAIATNADAPSGNPGPEGSFETKAPLEILETGVSGVGTETATLNAELNPLGIPLTTGFFEYVTEAAFQESGFATASKAPVGEPLDFGAGEAPVLRGTSLSGLGPATTYRYRLVATDSLISPKTVISPTKAFRTYLPGAGSLPDGRAYELVSPALKNSAEVAIPAAAGGFFNNEVSVRINAAAGTGEAVTYTSWTSFGEEAQGAPSSSQYLSKRGASGWGTANISARGFMKTPQTVPYRGFTADLGFGAFIVDEPALTPEAQAGFANLYLRDSQTGQIQALTTAEPQLTGSSGFCTGYAGASADGSRAIFAASAAIAGTGAPVGAGFSLYEWSASGGLSLVSVLPDGEPAPPVKPTSLEVGTGTGFGAVGGNCTMDQGIIRNAISEDGSTIFWRYGGKYGAAKEPLFARIGGTETIQLDAKPEENAGKGPFGQGTFRAATADGRYAFFTAPGKLTKDAEEAGQLYRYDTQSGALLDLTPGPIAPEVQGVVGASEDGAYLYFAAAAALSGEEENAAGQKAKAGKFNLYLWHQGEGLRFIATGGDQGGWSPSPERLTGRVTPDGRHLAFFSRETKGLSGYDNRISPGTGCEPEYGNAENELVGSPLCAEAYLYDAEADSLECVSCNPSGARPTGPSEVPGWTNPYEGPRYLSDAGSRLFFESRDVLSPADTNGKRDVYEYEVEGAGSCSEESSGFNPNSGGCLTLITSGQSEDESFFVDASSDGRDVFFSTRSALTGWDTNENYDVYDARIGGGFPEPPPPPVPCAGEACPAPPIGAPPAPTAATPNFQGAGNPKAKKPGRKARGHKKKHKHQAKKRKGAGQNRRSGR